MLVCDCNPLGPWPYGSAVRLLRGGAVCVLVTIHSLLLNVIQLVRIASDNGRGVSGVQTEPCIDRCSGEGKGFEGFISSVAPAAYQGQLVLLEALRALLQT